jgi:hypothetical protein
MQYFGTRINPTILNIIACTPRHADSFSGNFVWVDLGGRLGFRDAITEKKVFQLLLDGGVYIVRDLCLVPGSRPSRHFLLNFFACNWPNELTS